MSNANRSDRPQAKLPVVPIILGFITVVVTAIAVSRSTLDGNLVVTLVPALAAGLTVFGLALWCILTWSIKTGHRS